MITNLVTTRSRDEYKCTSIEWLVHFIRIKAYKELLWFFFNNILKYMDIYDTPGTCITNCSQVKSPFSLIYTYFTHAWKLFCLLLLYWITILLLSDFKTFVCYIDSVVYTALMAHCCNFRHFVCSNLSV